MLGHIEPSMACSEDILRLSIPTRERGSRRGPAKSPELSGAI